VAEDRIVLSGNDDDETITGVAYAVGTGLLTREVVAAVVPEVAVALGAPADEPTDNGDGEGAPGSDFTATEVLLPVFFNIKCLR
jgi:hypothetical protein